MRTKRVNNWCGLASVVWMVGLYEFLLHTRSGFRFEPPWLFMLTIFVSWLGIGFALLVAGFRRGNSAGRIGAIIASLVFIYFVWQMVGPFFIRADHDAMVANALEPAPTNPAPQLWWLTPAARHEPPPPRYIPSVSKDQEVPPVDELMNLQGMDHDSKYVRDFIRYWNLKKLSRKSVKTETYGYLFGNRSPTQTPSGHDSTNSVVEVTYGKRMTNGFSWSIVAQKYDENPDRIGQIVMHFTMGSTPAQLEIKARMLPHALKATDTPETVYARFGRPEAGLIEHGCGYLDYNDGIDRRLAFKVEFVQSNICTCVFE